MEKLDIMEKSVARIANGFDALFAIDAPTCTNDEQQGPPNIAPPSQSSTQTTSNSALFSNGPTSQSVPVEDFHVNEPIITLSARTVTSISGNKLSCSRQNFAVNMVRALYTQDEQKQFNVSGRQGKMKLEPQKMGLHG